MPTIPLTAGSTGLNTVTPPHRINYNGETGLSDIAIGVNVKIGPGYELSRANGHRKIHDLTEGHSLFCDGGDCLVRDGGSLYQVSPDGETLTLIKYGMFGVRMDCEQSGDAIYLCDGRENGIFHEGMLYPWDVDEYNGPELTGYLEETVPVFDKICIHNGYMLGVIGNTIYPSLYGYYGLYDLSEGIPFPSRIILIESVQDGVFVSDEKNHYFMRGVVPSDFIVGKPITNYPAYEWSAATEMVEAIDIGFDNLGQCRVWRSVQGIEIGTAQGQLLNATRSKIKFPCNGAAGASLVMGQYLISTVR